MTEGDPTEAPGAGDPVFLLVDNGSIRPESTLALRDAADGIARLSGRTVLPVSLAHSDRVPAEDLGGSPALTLRPLLLSDRIAGGQTVVLLPFFLGNRGAIVRMVEEAVAAALAERPGLEVRMAPFLFEEDGPGQETLALAAAERIRGCLDPGWKERPLVVFTDHGSPVPVAAQVRNFVAGQVQAILRDEVHAVVPASMERREGERYAFADPLLEEVLRRPTAAARPVILSMFFLLPGRHAGGNGDVAGIRDEAIREAPTLEVRTTGLLGDHPVVRQALADRAKGYPGTGFRKISHYTSMA